MDLRHVASVARDIASDTRTAVVVLAAATIAQLATWLVDTWWLPASLYLAAVSLLTLESDEGRERDLGVSALAVWGGVMVVWLAADSVAEVGARFGLEVALAVGIAASGTLLAAVVREVLLRRTGTLFKSPYLAAGVFWVGAGGRILELQTIADQADLGLYTLVLRHDIAQVIWAVASTLLFLNVLYTWLSARAIAWTPRLKKIVAVLAVVFTVGTHVGFVAVNVGATTADGRPPISVGAHADSVDKVPQSFDAMHLEVQWSDVQPRPDVWNWTLYDRKFDRAEARGLDVLLLVGMAPPSWLVEAHPDAVMMDAQGEVFRWLDTAPGEPKDRIHDMSFVDPEVNAAREEVLRRVVDRYADRSSVVAVAVKNEPAYPTDFNPFRIGSYDNATVDGFREWIRARYANATELNRDVGTDFENLSEVEPPPGLSGRWGRLWDRYRERTIIRHVHELMLAAREETDKPVTVKIMAHYLVRFAQPQTGLSGRVVEALVDMSDVVAVDLYPLTQNDLERSLRYYESLADGKPIWVAEFNYAAGPNLPTMGARTYATLDLLGQYADRVFFFTAEGHFLYGMTKYHAEPAVKAVELYKTPTLSPDFATLTGQLVVHELLAIANLYLVYATASAFFGFPIVPWAVLLVLAVPLPPSAPGELRHRAAGRIALAAGIWVAAWVLRTTVL